MNFLSEYIAGTREVPNCLICILRPSIESAPWIFPYECFCRHSSGKLSLHPHIRINKIWYGIHYVLCLVAFCGWFSNLYCLWIDQERNEVLLQLLVADLLFNIDAIIIYAMILFKRERLSIVIEINSKIVDDSMAFARSDYLSPDYRKMLRIRSFLERSFVYFVHSIAIVALLIFLYQYGISKDTVSILLDCASTMVLLTLGVLLVQQHDLLNHLVKVVFENIQGDLNDPIILNSSNDIFRRRIYTHVRLTAALKFATDSLVKFMDPGTVVYILTSLGIFIVDIYLNVLPWDEYYYLYIGIQQIRTFLLVVLLIEILRRMDLTHISEDALSFLYRYPMNKLTRQQAAQVEMLTTCLMLQRPVAIASDCVFMSKRLVGTITGTVVTYALVALQFREARNKH